MSRWECRPMHRPGLEDWLRDHWPPALAWGHPWTRAVARRHVRRHGWHEYASDCCLAAIKAWDSWDRTRSQFGSWFARVCRSTLRDRLKVRSRRPRPLADWDGPDHRDPTAGVDARDAAAWLTTAGPWPETCRDVLAVGVRETGRRLGLSWQAVYHRLKRCRPMLTGAETDIIDELREDVIVLPAQPQR